MGKSSQVRDEIFDRERFEIDLNIFLLVDLTIGWLIVSVLNVKWDLF